MFAKIKTLIFDIYKNQRILLLIILPIWIIPQLLFDVNYKYSIEGIILNISILFLLYGFKAIRFGKVYNAIHQFMTDNKNENIPITPAIFALNVFWNMMSLLLIIGFINYSIVAIPSIITYYVILSLMFIINIVAIQGTNYYDKIIKNLSKDFINKLEA